MENSQKIGLQSERDKEREFEEEVVEVARIARTVKGGRRIRFRAAVVAGDRKGRVGIGVDKANEVLTAVNKAKAKARKNLIEAPIVDETIPFSIDYKFRGAHVRLIPASMGTGVIAGGSVRVVIELAGVKNVLSKIMGSANKINNIKATYFALAELNSLYQAKKEMIKKDNHHDKIKPTKKDGQKQ